MNTVLCLSQKPLALISKRTSGALLAPLNLFKVIPVIAEGPDLFSHHNTPYSTSELLSDETHYGAPPVGMPLDEVGMPLDDLR